MTVSRLPQPLIGVCMALWACSDGTGPRAGSRTVLLTDSLPSDYVVVAIDETKPVASDTVGVIYVPAAMQACLRLSGVSLSPTGVVQLESFDATSGALIARTEVRPTLGSWAWDGIARNASIAPTC